MHFTGKRVGKGKFIAVDSELDFQLFHKDLGAAFVDTKSFGGDRFVYSEINEKQRDLANLLNFWGIQAGFIVWWRDADVVEFFQGRYIFEKGEGSSFKIGEGELLGSGFDFALGNLFR